MCFASLTRLSEMRIVADHSRKLTCVLTMVNPRLMSYDPENAATLTTNYRKKRRGNYCLNFRKRKVENKKFSNITTEGTDRARVKPVEKIYLLISTWKLAKPC